MSDLVEFRPHEWKDGSMSTTEVRRAQSVVWVSHEMEAHGGFREAIQADMRRKVEGMAGYEPGDPRVRLVSMTRLEPHDPEFDHLVKADGYAPPDASPYVAVWEVA